jgi:hypothetical protein
MLLSSHDPRMGRASPFSSKNADPGTESGMTQWEAQSLAKSKNVEPHKYRKTLAIARVFRKSKIAD